MTERLVKIKQQNEYIDKMHVNFVLIMTDWSFNNYFINLRKNINGFIHFGNSGILREFLYFEINSVYIYVI